MFSTYTDSIVAVVVNLLFFTFSGLFSTDSIVDVAE